MLSLEGRLAQLIKEARNLGTGTTVETVGDLQSALGSLDHELENTAPDAVQRRQLGRLRREAGLLLADARARAVLARDFG
ncbi:hypothetical protein [Nocardia pseudovaccinii]|uniref:hypothetical protein n=1 Tax=Nocardia pseudovaccinii TaxID=189540 RepID=UPI0007A4DD22|nr:hypothetical protein [Nocardia pseudovaccinii]